MGHTSENKFAESKEVDLREGLYSKYKPWIKTIFCSLLGVIHVGFLYNFGLFFDKLQVEFQSNVALTGWIGSISYSLFSFGTIFSTWLLRHLSHRKVGIIAVLLGSVSLFVCSLSPTIVYVIISYGVFYGLSCNITMIVAFDLVVKLFQDKRRAGAIALVLLGLGATVGNLSMSNMIEYILDQVGWRWTFRIFGCILLIVGMVCCSLYVAPKADEQSVVPVVDEKTKRISKRTTNGHLLCFPELWLFSLSTICASVALVFQYVNMASFLESIGLTDQKSATGITLIACGEVFAKIAIMVVASCISFPLIYCLPVSLFVSSILSITLTQTKNTFAIFLISICYGIPRGVYNGLQLLTGLEVFGASRSKTSATVVTMSSGIGNLAGPLIHGSLYDVSGSYYPALYLCTALFFISSFTMLLTPLWQKCFAPERYMVDYRRQNEMKDYQQCTTEYEHLEQMITVV